MPLHADIDDTVEDHTGGAFVTPRASRAGAHEATEFVADSPADPSGTSELDDR